MALIPVVDAAYGPRPIGVSLPASLTRPMFLGNELWQWIGVLLAAIVAYLGARILAAILVRDHGVLLSGAHASASTAPSSSPRAGRCARSCGPEGFASG